MQLTEECMEFMQIVANQNTDPLFDVVNEFMLAFGEDNWTTPRSEPVAA